MVYSRMIRAGEGATAAAQGRSFACSCDLGKSAYRWTVQEKERQAVEQLTATAGKLVELKARAAHGETEAAQFKQHIQGLRQEYRSMTVKLDDKVSNLVVSDSAPNVIKLSVLRAHQCKFFAFCQP